MKDDRGYCQVTIRIDPETASKIEELQKSTGLSIRDILGYSSKPCSCCKDVSIVAFNSQDKDVKIPRGILFTSLLTKHESYAKGGSSRKKNK
jgi:hypothetical protein